MFQCTTYFSSSAVLNSSLLLQMHWWLLSQNHLAESCGKQPPPGRSNSEILRGQCAADRRISTACLNWLWHWKQHRGCWLRFSARLQMIRLCTYMVRHQAISELKPGGLFWQISQPVVDRAVWEFDWLWGISAWLWKARWDPAILHHERHSWWLGQCSTSVEHSQDQTQCRCTLSGWCTRWTVSLSTTSCSQLLADKHCWVASRGVGGAGWTTNMWKFRLPRLSGLPLCIQQLSKTNRTWICCSVVSELGCYCVTSLARCHTVQLPETELSQLHCDFALVTETWLSTTNQANMIDITKKGS